MGAHDDYARKKAARRRAYRAAYQSAEAQEWITRQARTGRTTRLAAPAGGQGLL